jgi:MerR family transcriptional regulator, copper efflux regulator
MGQAARLNEWAQLLGIAAARSEVPGGATFVFVAEKGVEERVRQLAGAERACCGFFDFQVTRDGDRVEMTVVAPPDAQAALRFLFG